MSVKCWSKYDLIAVGGDCVYGVPDYDAWWALQYLYGVNEMPLEHVPNQLLDSIEYVGWCLEHGQFDSRYVDECTYLGLVVEDSEDYPYRASLGIMQWGDVKRRLREEQERDYFQRSDEEIPF